MTLRRQSNIVERAVWRHRRNRDRRVQITSVDGGWVFVRRNTSRRRQPIAVTTLLRDYEFIAMAPEGQFRP